MNSTPCYDCEKRKLGCHGNCSKYKDFRNKKDKVKARKSEESQYNNYVSSAMDRMIGSGRGLH